MVCTDGGERTVIKSIRPARNAWERLGKFKLGSVVSIRPESRMWRAGSKPPQINLSKSVGITDEERLGTSDGNILEPPDGTESDDLALGKCDGAALGRCDGNPPEPLKGRILVMCPGLGKSEVRKVEVTGAEVDETIRQIESILVSMSCTLDHEIDQLRSLSTRVNTNTGAVLTRCDGNLPGPLEGRMLVMCPGLGKSEGRTLGMCQGLGESEGITLGKCGGLGKSESITPGRCGGLGQSKGFALGRCGSKELGEFEGNTLAKCGGLDGSYGSELGEFASDGSYGSELGEFASDGSYRSELGELASDGSYTSELGEFASDGSSERSKQPSGTIDRKEEREAARQRRMHKGKAALQRRMHEGKVAQEPTAKEGEAAATAISEERAGEVAQAWGHVKKYSGCQVDEGLSRCLVPRRADCCMGYDQSHEVV